MRVRACGCSVYVTCNFLTNHVQRLVSLREPEQRTVCIAPLRSGRECAIHTANQPRRNIWKRLHSEWGHGRGGVLENKREVLRRLLRAVMRCAAADLQKKRKRVRDAAPEREAI